MKEVIEKLVSKHTLNLAKAKTLKEMAQCENDFTNYLLEAINYTRCSLKLYDLKVNRLEVIDKVGRSYVNYCDRPLNIEASLQDDDRTLKIFLDDLKPLIL